MPYVNYFRTADGGHMRFRREGDTAYQFKNDQIIGVFHRDGNTWTSGNGKRTFQTNDPNGIIASGISNGGTIDGGYSGWVRTSGHPVA